MFPIDQRSLATMWEEQKGGIAIEFHPTNGEGPRGWWEAHVVTKDGRARVMGARRAVKRWRDLGAAVRELSAILPGIREMKVVLISDDEERSTHEEGDQMA